MIYFFPRTKTYTIPFISIQTKQPQRNGRTAFTRLERRTIRYHGNNLSRCKFVFKLLKQKTIISCREKLITRVRHSATVGPYTLYSLNSESTI